MANPFLTEKYKDTETAIMLEQAMRLDIGKAVAYTDGDKIFLNTEDNLFNILPDYNNDMLKWLLWHEKMHLELKHHNRFFKYLSELTDKDIRDEFHVTKEEVNIIMDILVHDWMAEKFPELVETALKNLAQMRNRNSLEYTFKTFTLEEMLNEYKEHKKDPEGTGKGKDGESKEDEEKTEEDGDGTSEGKKKRKEDKKEDKPEKKDDKEKSEGGEKGHEEGGTGGTSPKGKDEDETEVNDAPMPDEHDKTDWSKLKEIDTKEFIDEEEGDRYVKQINRLKRKKFQLGKLTETLNGLATSTRKRSYAMPSTTYCGGGVMLKGSTPRTY